MIDAAKLDQHADDVGPILRPTCNRLHDNEVLDGQNWDREPSDIDGLSNRKDSQR